MRAMSSRLHWVPIRMQSIGQRTRLGFRVAKGTSI